MKFSIAVPSFQHGRFIRECLHSIEIQTHQNLEVLIADAGSTDGSLECIAEFTARDPRFRLVSRQDDGHADAVANALRLAVGDIHCFLNADDLYMDSQVLETVAREFERHPDAQLVTGGGVFVDEAGALLRPVRLRYHPFDSLAWMRWRTALLQPATFWRREVGMKVSFPLDAEYSFDSWFFYDAWSRHCQFREIPTQLARYRLHGTNKSLQINYERIEELARLEDHKFGQRSFRGRYLRSISRLIRKTDALSGGAPPLKRVIYLVVNSISFATAYRLPSI